MKLLSAQLGIARHVRRLTSQLEDVAKCSTAQQVQQNPATQLPHQRLLRVLASKDPSRVGGNAEDNMQA